MPELPEVETTRRGIEPHILNRRIQAFHIRDARLRWPVPQQALESVVGCRIVAVKRRGKYVLIALDDAAQSHIIVHLGMSGSLRIVDASEPPMVHDHVDLSLTERITLRYSDPRRFGCWLYTDQPLLEHELLARLGPEPLSDEFDVDYLYKASRGRKVAVKQFLMNSHVVVGVGNIYANEALFKAGISPTRAAGRISKVRYDRLVPIIKAVLQASIDQGGTTLRDFVGGDGKPGYFKQSLAVYGRGGQPCRTCQRELTEIRLGQRSTVFCKTCQT